MQAAAIQRRTASAPRFGKPDVDKAVKDNKYTADRHIVATSATATRYTGDAERKKHGWKIWDIGVRVRALPRVDARWLVEDHLGAEQRRAFLGPDGR